MFVGGWGESTNSMIVTRNTEISFRIVSQTFSSFRSVQVVCAALYYNKYHEKGQKFGKLFLNEFLQKKQYFGLIKQKIEKSSINILE